MKNKLSIISAILVFVLSAICFFACAQKDEAPVAVDYKQDNSFAVNTVEDDSALVFEPIADLVYGENGKSYKKVDYRYGVVFYTGLNINASEYSYLGNALAKQGYLVIIKKDKTSFYNYTATEEAFNKYPTVKFFIGGHSSEGGATAIRRASENEQLIVGALLFSPVSRQHKVLDENGNPQKDENGIEIQIADTLANSSLPTLLLLGDSDKVLTESQIADTLSKMPSNHIKHVIEGGTHIGFTSIDSVDDIPIKLPNYQADFEASDNIQKENQRALTIQYSLEFMKNLTK